MSFLKRKLGRKTDGGCLGIGRDPMIVRLRRRQKVMRLGTGVFLLRKHRNRQIKMGILSNVDKYDDFSQNSHETLFQHNHAATIASTGLGQPASRPVFVKTSTYRAVNGRSRPPSVIVVFLIPSQQPLISLERMQIYSILEYAGLFRRTRYALSR